MEILEWLETKNALRLTDKMIDPPKPIDVDVIEYSKILPNYIKNPLKLLDNLDIDMNLTETCISEINNKIPITNKIDILAWYQPIHFYGDNWGIYIFDSGIIEVMTSIFSYLPSVDGSQKLLMTKNIQAIAIEILRLHEEYHHRLEAFAIKQHIASGNILYPAYNDSVFLPTRDQTPCMCPEERLCDAYVYRALQTWLRPKVSTDIFLAVMNSWKNHMAIALGPYAGSLNLTTKSKFTNEQDLVLGQIVTSDISPNLHTVEKKFLHEYTKPIRELTENVYIVHDSDIKTYIPGVHQFAAPRRKVEKLILAKGYTETKEGDGSHTKYKKPGSPMIVLTKSREQSQTVLKSVAKALNLDLQEFLAEVREI